jgi:hypothetical protein
MAGDDLRARADARFERALADAGARDPREFYRNQLRDLKARDEGAYRRALAYFQERLIPAVADEANDPLEEWVEYGRVLATLAMPGRTVQIDATGRAADYARPVPPDVLVLHLPERTSEKAIVVGLPAKMSPAQRASYDLLVRQTQAL